MRLIVPILLALAVISTSVVLTSVSLLCDFSDQDIKSGKVSLEALTVGHVHQLFLTPAIWRRHPGCPAPGALLDWTALLTTGLFAFSAIGLLRFRFRVSWLLVSLVCLLPATLLYRAGMISLFNNTLPGECGP